MVHVSSFYQYTIQSKRVKVHCLGVTESSIVRDDPLKDEVLAVLPHTALSNSISR